MASPRLVIALAVVAAITVGCSDRPTRTPPPPARFDGQYHRFPTGLQLAVIVDPNAQQADVTVSYGAGSLDEPKGKEGLAHFVEHLTYRARPGGPTAPPLGSLLFATGAVHNAFTSHEETSFVATAPQSMVRAVLAAEALRMKSPLANLTPSDLDVERHILARERDLRQDESPMAFAMQTISGQLLRGHPYGRVVAGTPLTVGALTLADAKDWVAQHFHPENAVVVIVGARSFQQAQQDVIDAFGTLATGSGEGQTPPTMRVAPSPPQKLSATSELPIIVAPTEQRELWAVWLAPGRASGKELQLIGASVLMTVHLRREFSFIGQMKLEDLEPITYEGLSLIVARFRLFDGADAYRARQTLVERVRPKLQEIPLHRFAEIGREFALAAAFQRLETLNGQEIARYVRATGRSDFVSAYNAQIEKGITPEVAKFAEQLFTPEAMRTFLVVNGGAGTVVVRKAAAVSGAYDQNDLPPGEFDPKAIATPPGLARTTRFELPNGMEVIAIRNAALPRVDARLVLRLRPTSALEEPLMSLLGPAAWQEEAGFLLDYDVHGKFFSADHRTHLCRGATVLSGHLEGVLDSVRHWLMYPEISGWEQYGAKRRLALALERMKDDPWSQAAEVRTLHLLGAPELTAEDFQRRAKAVAEVKAEAFNRWADTEVRPQNATLILVGDLPEDDSLQLMLERKFLMAGNRRFHENLLFFLPIPPKNSTIASSTPPPPMPKERLTVVFPSKSRLAHVVVAARTPLMAAGQQPTWAVLQQLIERRLTGELRERRGDTYWVGVDSEELGDARMVTIETRVPVEQSAAAIQEIVGVLAKLAADPVDARSLLHAQWEVARHYGLGFRTLNGVGDFLESSAIRGQAPSYWDEVPSLVAKVTAEDALALARTMSIGTEAITVDGDVDRIEKVLTEAGLKPKRFERKKSATEAKAPVTKK